jgi:ribosomal protein S25
MIDKPPKPPKPEGRAAAPRRKSKKKKSDKATQAEIPIIDIVSSRLSDDIPDAIKIAIADAVMAYALMEGTAERLIWDITGLSYDDGRLLTRTDSSDKFEVLKTLTENYGLIIHYSKETRIEMWAAIKQLMPIRNLLVHGIWAMLDHQIPVTISRRFKTTTGNVLGEAFPLERLQSMARQCYRVKKSFDGLSERVRASPPIRPARYPPDQPSQNATPKNETK